MEDKTVSEKIEDLAETLKLYIVQNATEIVDAVLTQPLEKMRKRILISAIAGFLFCIASVFLALALSFLCAAILDSLGLSGSRDVVWGFSYFFVFLAFGGAGYILLRRCADGRESNR